METAEEKTVEEEEGWMELAEDEMEDEEMVAFGVEDAVEEEEDLPAVGKCKYHDKRNNKITELRTIFQREKQSTHTDKISQQPANWRNRNDPDLVLAFQKN